MIKHIPIYVIAAFKAYRMSKKWNWYNYYKYLYISLKNIRKEFNIKMLNLRFSLA